MDATATGNVFTGNGGIDSNATDGVADMIGADVTATPVTAVGAGTTTPTGGVGSAITGTYGTLTLSADGSYSYAPDASNPDVQGLGSTESATDLFTYVITDADGDTATATLQININGTNDTPFVISAIPVQSADDSKPVTPLDTSVFFGAVDSETLVFDIPAAPDWLTIDPATGILTGTPPLDASQGGPAGDGVYPVTVSATDADGAVVTTVVDFEVTNPAPTAVDDEASTDENRPVILSVMDNDFDIDGDPINVTDAIAPNGTITINADNTITYLPNLGFVGMDVLTYTIDDGNGGTSTASIEIEVRPIIALANDPEISTLALAEIPRLGQVTADGAVLDALNTIGGRNGNEPLEANGIVQAAANGISSLNGLERQNTPLTEARISILNQWLQSQIREEETFDVKGLTGFSLRMGLLENINGEADKPQIVIETLLRDQALMIQLSNTIGEGNTSISEYRITQADGTPLPDWLNVIGRSALFGKTPADLEHLQLRLDVIYDDGTSDTRSFELQTNSGEIQPLREVSSKSNAKSFAEQFNAKEIPAEAGLEQLSDFLK